MFTRDHVLWSLGFVAAVLSFLTASTTHLIPAAYVPTVQEVSAVLAFICGKLGNSPLPGR